MRPIKFRAWDGNKMIPHDTAKYFVEFDGTVWENEGTFYLDELSTKPDLILMQFTGLHDKNGKEIYEGDVVSFLSQSFIDSLGNKPLKEKTGLVQWNDEYLKWDVVSDGEPIPSLSRRVDDKEFTIIGNIYENHELLDNSNDFTVEKC